jgi:putative transposase
MLNSLNQGGNIMKTKRYSTEQIISILKAVLSVQELCRKYGISDATVYNWKSKYGNLSISEAHRLKALESENHRLKKIVADQALDIEMLKEITTKKW